MARLESFIQKNSSPDILQRRLLDITRVVNQPSLMILQLTGVKNGVNKVFKVSNTPIQFFWNGVLQTPPSDYVLNGLVITMTLPPAALDSLVAFG